ncbi:hypothetical protein M9Y10_030941 [Tritrichomonas musculus]|uniref:DUF3447 domain-containing protein n=1 Tax=Tritrichomonas musculus TaxID=1915356 RepID=A0ABR2H4J8_9EUKA
MTPPNLIEYSAFFISCSIFKYLFHNGAEIKPSIWAYAVHSNNQEMIDLLEKNQIKLKEYDDDNNEEEEEEIFPFKESVLKSIAYHNNVAANFILNKYEKEKAKKSKNSKYKYKIEKLIISKAFQNYNFKNNDIFFYLCIYDYVPLVKTFISTRKINIETIRILYLKIL